jgi:hypothetical protein
MPLLYETATGEDLDVGTGTVTKTAPAGGTMSGTQISISTLGTNGATTSAATATWDPASVLAAQSTSTTISWPGAQMGDFVLASFSLDLQGCTLSAYVSAVNVVTAVISNPTTTAIDLASGTLKVLVLRPR